MTRVIYIFSVLILGFYTGSAQNFDNLTFGTDDTFEVVTWNIEQFPKNGQVTVNYVSNIIEALDVDLLALQEINDIGVFNQMVNSLGSYSGYLDSLWFGGLAYIYNSNTVQINNIYEIYTTSEYWSYFPRSPMVMDLDFMGERFIIINNHLKCCGDGDLDISDVSDEETRRFYANTLLKEYVDLNFSNDHVIILGDLNDSLIDATTNNVFQMLLDDFNNFLFTDFDIASGSDTEWSFPSWPSHLDHILITNELFDEFQDSDSDIQTIKIEDYLSAGWNEYDSNISDHRPVALKLKLNNGMQVEEIPTSTTTFKNYPNPIEFESFFSFDNSISPQKIELYNLKGQIVKTIQISPGQSFVRFDASDLSNGIYIAKLFSGLSSIAIQKIVVAR